MDDERNLHYDHAVWLDVEMPPKDENEKFVIEQHKVSRQWQMMEGVVVGVVEGVAVANDADVAQK